MLDFSVQNHRPLRTVIYDELKARIINGDLPPGTRLLEVEIAEKLGVSRTPIREAIRMLENDNLLTGVPRMGVYVSKMSGSHMQEVLEVRQSMEKQSAYFAAMRIIPEDIGRLKDAHLMYELSAENKNIKDMMKYDVEFHRIIVKSCYNKMLLRMFERVEALEIRFRYLYYAKFKKNEEHSMIFQAIKNGDATTAAKIAYDHVAKSMELITEKFVS